MSGFLCFLLYLVRCIFFFTRSVWVYQLFSGLKFWRAAYFFAKSSQCFHFFCLIHGEGDPYTFVYKMCSEVYLMVSVFNLTVMEHKVGFNWLLIGSHLQCNRLPLHGCLLCRPKIMGILRWRFLNTPIYKVQVQFNFTIIDGLNLWYEGNRCCWRFCNAILQRYTI